MYSNSVKRNPIFHKKRAPKEGSEHFSVGCVTESTAYDAIPKTIHRTKYVQQNYDIRNNTSRTILEYNEALNYEKNANLQLFSDILTKTTILPTNVQHQQVIGDHFTTLLCGAIIPRRKQVNLES